MKQASSRLKKKLLLYFLLVTIVSVSVSAEMILELSGSKLRKQITATMAKEGNFDAKKIDISKAFMPLADFQIRMVLLLLLILGVNIGALLLFSREVAKPMDALVAGAKKVADGDFSGTIETNSTDEIGQVAGLINQMNSNTQELVVQVRHEVDRINNRISDTQASIMNIMQRPQIQEAMVKKTISSKDLSLLLDSVNQLGETFDQLKDEIGQMSEFVSMYKVYDSFQDESIYDSRYQGETIH